jgi:tetratricopeptide (TPR) repeat protein
MVKAADQIKAIASPPRPSNVSDADWQKALQEAATQASEWRDRMAGAFFQILPRVTDANKRIETLANFAKAYPEAAGKTAGQLNYQYAIAYTMAGQVEKADEAGEKSIAADPNNVEALNLVAYDYAISRQINQDKAADYAKKALQLAQSMKKPEGVSDDQFKKAQNNQFGMAHLTLGYVSFVRGSKTHRVAPAIQEFKTAVDLLDGNPALQGQSLYFLGYAYEDLYPANHRGAIEALTRASSIQSPWQGQARDLLAKVRQATGGR